ncbi:MAG TPA: sigma-54 dependent transcriptional regulator [Bryobacteraceae bacterium]|nr:sigma-54 dependent transcriptional regulator [Bryobacteraceae bacterium]
MNAKMSSERFAPAMAHGSPPSALPRHVLVGRSPRARRVLDLIEKVGAGRWPALILGETGTGKEVVAREIHARNPQGPFVTIDCSALVGPLMESELFGHVKGAFTGASHSKTGLIEAANGGTAFFDEIGELPLDLQAKLLRVLQEKEFRPLGSLTVRRSDFRVVAATNRDLAKEVEKGAFRRDLFFRLNVVKIQLAPLRERPEDIPALIDHFLARAGANRSLTAEALDAMVSYPWPGNVRELENCIQQMVALHRGPLLHVPELPSPLQNHLTQKRFQYKTAVAQSGAAGEAATPGRPAHPYPTASPPELLPSSGVIPIAELERRAILHALHYTRGDRALAAHLLGIGRTTLYRKLKEYKLE